jgi:hypothetical protein
MMLQILSLQGSAVRSLLSPCKKCPRSAVIILPHTKLSTLLYFEYRYDIPVDSIYHSSPTS